MASLGPDCNLRCRYCLETNEVTPDFNTCEPKILNILYDFICRGGHAILTGGETFLPKWGLIDHLRKISCSTEVKGSIDIHTNGTFLDKEAIDIIVKCPFKSFGISMDTYKPKLFNWLRRGADFGKVLGNVLNLKRENDKNPNSSMTVAILCAVMKSTYAHLYDTVDFYANIGLFVSLNALFECPFSPTFSREQGLHNLSVEECGKLYKTLERIAEDFEGHVYYSGIKGQVEHILRNKLNGINYQVKIGQE